MLSKSRYCAFVQCPKNLWLKVNRPELAEKDNSAEARMDIGNTIGGLSRQLFGDPVNVTAYKPDGGLDLSKMIDDTMDLVNSGAPVIAEASFSYIGNYCAVDILKREGDGYAIYEVKSSSGAKDIYITDIAYQRYVLEHSGVNVTGAYLVCINSDYVFDGELKLDEFFEVVDVREEVDRELCDVVLNVAAAHAILTYRSEPCIDLSEGCHAPYDCAFWKYCTRDLPTPSVFDVYGAGFGFSKKLDYYKRGITTFEALSRDRAVMKTKIRSLQINHAISDLETHVDKKEIAEFLDTLSYPLYFLDFETMQLVIPEFVGTKPYAQIPFQYSLHYIEEEGGELRHKEFLAESGENPLRAIAERLCEDIPTNATVIVYNKSFESARLRELAEFFPELSEHLLKIESNIADLLEPFRKGYYYNRRMNGSFSIKSVLPAIFPDDPELDYHNLEGVHNGSEAMDIFPRIKYMSPEKQAAARRNLLRYCELDTYATVKIWQELVRVSK